MSKKKIGILTGGGDCPGLNAVIRGVTKCAINEYGMDVIGFHDGFLGLIEKRFSLLSFESVSGILTQGGTILGSDNKANPFEFTVTECNEPVKVDVSEQCMELYEDLGLDALICVGGDGTMTIAGLLAEKGAKIVGLPKTIDKDLEGTDITFGFDSARAIATEALDRVHTTAQSHHRVLLVEIMGRNAGWLTLESGIAGGADVILIPEIPYEIKEITTMIRKRSHFGRRFSIIAVAEGALPAGGKQTINRIVEDSPDPVRLGGVSHIIADQLEKETGIECRVAILGHVQRGGSPTPSDRLLGTQLAVKAMDLVATEQFNHMAALNGTQMVAVPLKDVAGRQRLVPLDSPLIRTALSVGTSFGARLSV